MRKGRYFSFPHTPADRVALWKAGIPLTQATAPSWMVDAGVENYRRIGCIGPIHGEIPADCQNEMAELTEAGIIIEPPSPDRPVAQFYLQDPKLEWFNEAVWAIGLYEGKSPDHLLPMAGAVNPILTREMVTDAPAGFVADPFLIQVKGVWHLFFEVMNTANARGEIGLATSEDLKTWDYQQMVLTEPFHLSYPAVFEHAGQHFMVPESHQAGAVRLYRAAEFPRRWEWVMNLVEGPYLADPSLFQHDGRWWMFVDVSTDLANDTLDLYVADRLTGPWRRHPASPIVRMNPYTARPGGRVIQAGQRLIRYAQGCLPFYGTDVRAFEITELTPTAFTEREMNPLPILGPAGHGWNARGMHHVDAHLINGRWVAVVDGWS